MASVRSPGVGAGAELPQAVRGDDDLQPRRRRRRHRLPVAGLGDHPQPAADRPRRRRPAPAVAAVHAAGRRHHRPQRPAPADGRRQRGPVRAHRRRRRSPCSSARDVAAGARRRRPGRRHRVVPVRGRCSSRRCCSGRARCSTTTAPRRSCRRSSTTERPRAGQRADVLGRDRRQPVRSARRSPACCCHRVRPAVRLRRRDVRRRRPGSCSPSPPRRRPVGGRRRRRAPAVQGRSWPRASAGCGTTTCCARSPSRSACSTCSATSAAPSFVLCGQEVLGTSTLEFALLSTAAAIGGVAGGWLASAVTKRIGSGPSLGLTLWLARGVTVARSAWCRSRVAVVALLLVRLRCSSPSCGT